MKRKSKIGFVLLVSIIIQLIIFVLFGVLDEIPTFLGITFFLLFPTNIVLFILYIIRKIKGWKISDISKCEEKTFTGIAKEMGKIALETAIILQNLHEILKKESPQTPTKDKTYLLFRIKDQSTRNNCSTEDIKLFEQRIKERTTTIGYELTTGRIIGSEAGEEWEDTSKIVVKIDNSDIVKIDFQNEINLKQINETLTKIETLIKNKYNKKIEINYIIRDKSKTKGEKKYLEISEKDKPIWWEEPGIVNPEKLDVILTDELIGIVEQKLKHKLPKKYLELLNSQNGGRLIRRYYYFSKNDRIFEIDSIYGISDNFEHGIVEENIIASDWSDYINLNNNIVFGGDISAGHAHYLFDYTDLNEVGEPKIIWYDNELDEKILLANSFEEFIDNLKSEEGIEPCIYEPEKNK